MSITGPGSITAANVAAQTNMMNQLNTLSEELGTGQAAQTYSGLGSQAGVVLALNAQLSDISGYGNTATAVGTNLSIAQSVLSATRQHQQRGATSGQSARPVCARQYRPNFNTGVGRELPGSNTFAAQYAGGR